MKWIEFLEARSEPLNAKEVAKILGISRQQVYKMAGKEIACAHFNGSVRFFPEAVLEYVRQHIVQSVVGSPAVKHPGNEFQNGVKRR